MKIELFTERLRIHEFTPECLASIHEYAIDPEVIRHQHWGPNTEQETREFLQYAMDQQSKKNRNVFELAVSLRENGKHIGGARLGLETGKKGDIGYSLRHDQWGKGLGTELACEMLAFGFRDFQLHRIYATAAPENIASHRVLEKCGLRREGLLKENLYVRGEWRDSVLYAILEQEWRKSAACEA